MCSRVFKLSRKSFSVLILVEGKDKKYTPKYYVLQLYITIIYTAPLTHVYSFKCNIWLDTNVLVNSKLINDSKNF